MFLGFIQIDFHTTKWICPLKDRERLPIHKGLPINYMILKDLFVRIQKDHPGIWIQAGEVWMCSNNSWKFRCHGINWSSLIIHGSSVSTWIASTFELKWDIILPYREPKDSRKETKVYKLKISSHPKKVVSLEIYLQDYKTTVSIQQAFQLRTPQYQSTSP